MNSRRRQKPRLQETRDSSKGRPRVLANQRGGRTGLGRRPLQNNHSRSRDRELAAVAGFRQESDRLTVGIRERPDTLNQRVGTATKLAAKSDSDFPERDGHKGCFASDRRRVAGGYATSDP